MRYPGTSKKTFALQLIMAALVVFAGAVSLLFNAHRLLPAPPRSSASDALLWATIALLVLGGAVLLAFAGRELRRPSRARRSARGRSP